MSFRRSMSFKGLGLFCALVTHPPFVIASNATGLLSYTGLAVDLLDIIADHLNFTYTLLPPPDGEWGIKRDGQWTGIIGLLERREVDLTTEMTLTPERMEVTEWTMPLEYTSSTVAVRSLPAQQKQWGAFLAPFAWQMYVYLLCVFLVCMCLLRSLMTHYGTTRHQPTSPSFYNTGEFLLGSLLREAMPQQWTRGPTRLLVASWCMLGVLISACYTSKLTSLFVDVSPVPPFTSLADMVKRDDFRWGSMGGTSKIEMFRNATDPVTRAVYEGMTRFARDDPDVMSSDPHTQVDKVLRGGYAFIGGRNTLWQSLPACRDVVLLDESIFGVEVYVLFGPKNSTLTKEVSKVILRLQDSGLLLHLRSKWFSPQNGCHDKATSPQAITIATMQGPCYAAVTGLILAAGAFCFELALRKWNIPWCH